MRPPLYPQPKERQTSMYVMLTIHVPKLKTTKEGQDWCYALAEHITATYNTDQSIESISYTVPKTEKG